MKKEWGFLETSLRNSYENYIKSSYQSSILEHKLLISGEDHRFFSHYGFDLIAILRALWRNFAFNKHEGASTIEQQVVRTLTGNYERTIQRKLKEIFLATLVKNVIPKQDLPGLYLDIAYYGWRMNGFRQACLRLKLDPKNLHISQAASLVARLKYPEPKRASFNRITQIQCRSNHLIFLFNKHSLTTIYSGFQKNETLYNLNLSPTTQNRFSTAV